MYTPVIEGLINSVQAIEERGVQNGTIVVRLIRSQQETLPLDEAETPHVTGLEIEDNGIGFNEENRASFDCVYSDRKISHGGKGFGRFTYLKYFRDVEIESVFETEHGLMKRTFQVGRERQIIENEKIQDLSEEREPGTILRLQTINGRYFEKKPETIAKKILERILVYFITNKGCPDIIIEDPHSGTAINLKDYLAKESGAILPMAKKNFTLQDVQGKDVGFQVDIFKIYYPDNQSSKISLVAHNREVSEIPIQRFVPEFAENFFEETETDDGAGKRDYRIKSFVTSEFLDHHVSAERTTFTFPRTDSMQSSIWLNEDAIAKQAAQVTRDIFPDEISTRRKKKERRIRDYVNTSAPWHKDIVKDINLDDMPYTPDDATIESALQSVKFKKESASRQLAKEVLDGKDLQEEKAEQLLEQISEVSKNDLAHYVSWRKVILDIFRKSLSLKPSGKYSREDALHDIIFPTKSDSDTTPYKEHNLWLISELLNFTEFVASDRSMGEGNLKRPDLLIFNRKAIAMREANEPSNPITIFEFKRPQREDFASRSSKENPITQIINYVNDLKDGKFKTPEGRDIQILDNTQFYGYVVCDITKKVSDWLATEEDFKEMPDGMGWYTWKNKLNLYIEVLSWDKTLADAERRNRIFFEKLKI